MSITTFTLDQNTNSMADPTVTTASATDVNASTAAAGTMANTTGSVTTAIATMDGNSSSSPCGCHKRRQQMDDLMSMAKAIHVLHIIFLVLLILFIIHLIRKP